MKIRVVATKLGLGLLAITAAHLGLNVDWSAVVNDRLPPQERMISVGYIPVT